MIKMMLKIFITLCSLIAISPVFASNSFDFDSDGFITKKHALTCIQTNQDMKLASQQMLKTESNKSHLKSKINYLQKEITKRRNLIEKLDQQNIQSNNDNYNALVTQFEDLVDERKQVITQYNDENQLHKTQHESVVRLEQRFSKSCLNGIKITQKMHQDVCQSNDIRWCSLFTF